MPPTCKTCKRSDADEINKLIVGGTTLRYITDNYGIPNGSIQRHKETCLPGLFAEVRQQLRAGLLGKVDVLEQKFIAVEKEFGDNWQARIAAGGKQIDLLEKEAKLTGAYTKDQENSATINDMAQAVVDRLMAKGFTESEARDFANQEFHQNVSEMVN